MTTASPRSRQPKGVSTGGQFAAEHRPEAPTVALGSYVTPPGPAALAPGFTSPAFLMAVGAYRDAVELQEYAHEVRRAHPEAVKIQFSGVEEDFTTVFEDAEGEVSYVSLPECSDVTLIDGTQNNQARAIAEMNGGWIGLDEVDSVASWAEQNYAKAVAVALLPGTTEAALKDPGARPSCIPADHRIEVDSSEDGDPQAIIMGPDGQVASMTVMGHGLSYRTSTSSRSPQWAKGHEGQIHQYLTVVAENGQRARAQITDTLSSMRSIQDHLNRLSTFAR